MHQKFSPPHYDRVWIDADAAAAVREECERRGAGRVLVLVSATLNRPDGAAHPIIDALGTRVIGVFDGLSEHTPLPRILDAAALARRYDADLLLAIGGGSVIDGTKALRAALANDLQTVEDFARHSLGAVPALPLLGGGPAVVAVPTTLSAAEFSDVAGYTNPATGLKTGLRVEGLSPDSIIFDPDLALYTPLTLWLSSGIRAVDHAVEAIFADASWPGLRAQAAAGLRLLAAGLRGAAERPGDTAPRALAQQGVWLISIVMDRVPMGASHGLGYLLGTLGQVPHGLTSCVLLPTVIAWNSSVRTEAAAEVALALGATSAIQGVSALIKSLGLPTRIGDLGVDHGLLDRIAAQADRVAAVRSNPRKLRDTGEIRELLERAW